MADQRYSKNHLFSPVDVSEVPDNLSWKRSAGRRSPDKMIEYSFGAVYKRCTNLKTGEAAYYRSTVLEQATPADKLDTEPDKGPQVRYNTGALCWFVDNDARWYLCLVTRRTQEPFKRITISSHTGQDATNEKSWPYGDELEFSCSPTNQLFRRLRPLKARKV